MAMIKIKYFIVLLTFCSAIALAQTQYYTFEQCVKMGIENNIDLQIQNNTIQSANYDTRETRWDMAPSISGYGNANIDLKRSTDQNNDVRSGVSYYSNYGISGSMSLFHGLTQHNIIAARKYMELSYKETAKKMQNQLYLDIAQYFSEALYTKELIQVSEENLEIRKAEYERIISNINLGLAAKADSLEAQASVSDNELDLQRLKNSYKLSLMKLAQLIGLESTLDFDIDDAAFLVQKPVANEYTTELVYSQACNNLPEIQSLEYSLMRAKKYLNVYRGNFSPSLSVSGGYSSNFYSTDTLADGSNTPFDKQFKTYLNPNLRLSLSVPIFSGFSKRYDVKRQKLEIKNTMLRLQNQKRTIRTTIESTLMQMNAYKDEYESASENLRYVKEYFDSYKEKYNLGMITSTEFNEAQNKFSSAKANVISARYNWIVQEKVIKVYSGEAILPINN